MDTVLSKATRADLRLEPFPHVVIRDALDADLCSRLVEHFPPLPAITGRDSLPSNSRYTWSGSDALADEVLSPPWREMIQAHTCQRFLDQSLALFGEAIRAEYPDFEDRFGPLETLTTGMRKVASHEDVDVLLDGQICFNSPVTKRPSSVRKGHLDLFEKLFAGLFYLRHPDDDSEGGALELYRFKPGPYSFHGKYIDHRYLEVVETVPYEQNVLVYFLNTRRSLHGVTVRKPTPFPRLFFNIVAEMREQLFDLDDCQEGIALRAARRSQKLLDRLSR